MFPIKIGTLIPAHHAPSMLPALNKMGFECYEMNLNEPIVDGNLAVRFRRWACTETR